MIARFFLPLFAALLVMAPAHAQDAPAADPATPPVAPAAEAVTVPNFWDPRQRIERPSVEELGPIRFLTTDDFPPFAFRDRRGLLVGFDIDLAQAVCQALKAQCAMQVRPFDTLVAGLKDGTGNAIIAGFDLDKANAEGLIASQAYLKIPARFLVRRAAPFDPAASGADAVVGVQCGSAHAAYLARFYAGLRTACFQDNAALLSELKAGKVAAIFGDALRFSFWLNGEQSEECCAFAAGAFLDDRYFGSGLAIVTRAEDRGLKFALDYALREVYRSGTYEELYLRYFPVGLF